MTREGRRKRKGEWKLVNRVEQAGEWKTAVMIPTSDCLLSVLSIL